MVVGTGIVMITAVRFSKLLYQMAMIKTLDLRHGSIVSALMKLNTAREYISTLVDRMTMDIS